MSVEGKIRRWPPSSVEDLRGVLYSIDAKVERADQEELKQILQANGAVGVWFAYTAGCTFVFPVPLEFFFPMLFSTIFHVCDWWRTQFDSRPRRYTHVLCCVVLCLYVCVFGTP